MDTNELRENCINLMSKTIMDANPKMIIRRLQNDNAFAIYSNVEMTDTIGNTYKHMVLIAIITQKSNPKYFNSINNLIRFINDFDKEGVGMPESYHLKNMFHSVFVRDNKGNILEKLIEFNHYELCSDESMVVNNYTTEDDVYNLISMLYKCARFLIDHGYMFNKFFPVTKSPYTHFKYGAFLMDNQAAEDEILHKVITDDLYGYQIIDHEGKFAELKNKSQSIMYETECSNKSCIKNDNDDCENNHDGCLTDTVLYYTAKSSLDDTDKEVYLKGEFVYLLMTYNDTNIFNSIKRYLVPRTWFDFEEIHYYDAKIKNMVYDNCGRSLMCN